MARKDLGVIRQAKQALDNICSELLVTASRKIGTTDATAEECVASEDPAFDFGVETDATDGMARRANDLKGTLPYFNDFTVLQIDIRQVAVARKRQPEHGCLLPRTEKVALYVGMRRHLNAITLFHGIFAHDMVDVTMRVDDH